MKSLFLGCLLSALVSQAHAVDYFAFFADAMNGVGEGNYIDETADFSNAHFISAPFQFGTTSAWTSKVLQAREHNNKSILMLEGFLFNWRTVELNKNHHTLLSTLKSQLKGLENEVVAIYLIDEPYFKNSLTANPLSRQEVYENLQMAARIVRGYFPNAKLAITEAYPVIDANLEIPPEVDWMGINCYLAFGQVCTLDKIKSYTSLVSKKLNANQRFVFTLDGYWHDQGATKTTTQNQIIARNKELMKIAKQYNAVAFFPFLYQTDLSGEQLYGTDRMPLVQDYLSQIGIAVKNNTFKYADECAVLEPKCEGKDYVRRDSCGKEIERWKNAPAPYCPGTVVPPTPVPAPTPTNPSCVVQEPKCEGKDYVRRDSCGKEIERWKNAPKPYCPGTVAPPAPTPTNPSCVVQEPKCEGKDYVRRDSCGKEIERWKNAPAPYCKK